jgi:hypothetical protein
MSFWIFHGAKGAPKFLGAIEHRVGQRFNAIFTRAYVHHRLMSPKDMPTAQAYGPGRMFLLCSIYGHIGRSYDNLKM